MTKSKVSFKGDVSMYVLPRTSVTVVTHEYHHIPYEYTGAGGGGGRGGRGGGGGGVIASRLRNTEQVSSDKH